MQDTIDIDSGRQTVGPPDGVVVSYDLRRMRAYCEEKGIEMAQIAPEEQQRFAVGSFFVGLTPGEGFAKRD